MNWPEICQRTVTDRECQRTILYTNWAKQSEILNVRRSNKQVVKGRHLSEQDKGQAMQASQDRPDVIGLRSNIDRLTT